jgi:hypothetical protein
LDLFADAHSADPAIVKTADKRVPHKTTLVATREWAAGCESGDIGMPGKRKARRIGSRLEIQGGSRAENHDCLVP